MALSEISIEQQQAPAAPVVFWQANLTPIALPAK